MENSFFSVADGRIKFSGGDQELRTSTLIRDHPIRGRRSRGFSWRIRRVSTHYLKTHFRMPVKHEMIFGPCQETSYTANHVEPRVKLYSPREEPFPIPLKYIDVSRTTHTTLDVLRESRIDYYWNIDGSTDLSATWTGFTQFTPLSEKPPEGHMWSRGRLTGKQLTSRPDHLWPELWRGMSKNAKLWEKHKWTIEKPKLDNARRLRGIYFIDPEDMEFKEIIKNCKKKIGNTNGSRFALQDEQEEQ